MRNQKNLRILVECAIMIALAAVLSYVKIWRAPLGGSVTLFSMVPIIIIGLRHGPVWGFICAFVYSVVQCFIDISELASYGLSAQLFVSSLILDYFVAFTVLGTAGFFKPLIDNSKTRTKKIFFVMIAAGTACVLRYITHVIVGAFVWYEFTKLMQWNEYAASGWTQYINKVGMWVYSAVYNLQFMLPETIITLVAAPAIVTILSVISNQKKNTLQ